MQTHQLRISREYYANVCNERKKCEIRLNDRDFQCGDSIRFYDTEGQLYLPAIDFGITHVLQFPEGLKEGYVALSIKPTKDNDKKE